MTSFRLRGSRRGARRAVYLALAVTLAIAVGASSASATPLGANLIVNPGAENGSGANVLTGEIVVPTGWTTTSNFTAAVYASAPSPDFVLDRDDAALIGGGNNYFAGGPINPLSTASQIISFDDLAADVDAGRLSFLLTGYLGGYSGQNDAITIGATFLDGTNAVLLASLLGPVNSVTVSVIPSCCSPLRADLRSRRRAIRSSISLAHASRVASNDSYADNLSLLFQSLDTGSGSPRVLMFRAREPLAQTRPRPQPVA